MLTQICHHMVSLGHNWLKHYKRLSKKCEKNGSLIKAVNYFCGWKVTLFGDFLCFSPRICGFRKLHFCDMKGCLFRKKLATHILVFSLCIKATVCHGHGKANDELSLNIGDLFGFYLDPLNFLLTHWGRDKMAAISQTTFLNAFSEMKIYEFRLRFHRSLFLEVQTTISHHWFR